MRTFFIVLMISLAPVAMSPVAAQDVPAPSRALAVTTDANGTMRNAQCSDYKRNADGSWSTSRPMAFVVAEDPSSTGGDELYVRLRAGRYNLASPITFNPGTLLNGVDLGGQLELFCAR